MHLTLLLGALGLAWSWRSAWTKQPDNWQSRWQHTLAAFLFAPLLLLSSAIAVIWMGPRGQMVYAWEGWLSYGLAVLFIGIAVGLAVKLGLAGLQAQQQFRAYPPIQIGPLTGYLLPNPLPFIAQVGFWKSDLVMSQGLLEILTAEHLQAAIAHEQAHAYYRDTFWFFWLGWLRRLTFWLPQTETLWEELLLLRELRADHWAAQQVDRLTLAEALLMVVKTPQLDFQASYAALSDTPSPSRLEERISALLEPDTPLEQQSAPIWIWLMPVFFPLMIIPMHS